MGSICKHTLWIYTALPLFLLSKSYVTPIFRIFLGTDSERIHNGGRTVLEYRQEKSLNVKNKKFLRWGVTPIAEKRL